MRKMNTPKMEVIRFKNEDVIVASGFRLSVAGFDDTTEKNGVFTLDGVRYGQGQNGAIVDKSWDEFLIVLSENHLYNGDFGSGLGTGVQIDGRHSTSIHGLYDADNGGNLVDFEDTALKVNGTYRWNGTDFIRQ